MEGVGFGIEELNGLAVAGEVVAVETAALATPGGMLDMRTP